MKKEFNLSEKIDRAFSGSEHYKVESLFKEFIKRLKTILMSDVWTNDEMIDIIDELAGDKLTK